MNRILYFAVIILLILGHISNCASANGISIKYISGYEADFNNDRKDDIAILFESTKGYQLIVLLKTTNGYNNYLIYSSSKKMILSCGYGDVLKETTAGKNGKTPRTYKTKGAYLKLSQPEGSEVAFYWSGKKFDEIWLMD